MEPRKNALIALVGQWALGVPIVVGLAKGVATVAVIITTNAVLVLLTTAAFAARIRSGMHTVCH